MRLTVGILVFFALIAGGLSLQCRSEEGAEMLMYRICAADYQCATRNQITTENTMRGIALNSATARLHNEGYQVMANTVAFLQLIRTLEDNKFATEDEFASATLQDAHLREGDIFYAIWEPSTAAQLPRIFHTTQEGSEDCKQIAMSEDPIPRDLLGQYVASLYALNTYRVEIATPPECNSMNEDRILDIATGEYYCSCRPGKVCTKSNQMLPARIALLIVLAVASVAMLIFITWKGGNAFYSVDKLEAYAAEYEKTIY